MALAAVHDRRSPREIVVHAHIYAEAVQHDISATLATFSRPRYEVPAMGGVIDGQQAVHDLLSALLSAFPDFWLRIRRSVPIIRDEFGAFREHTRPEDRLRWLSAVRMALEKNHIGWAMWDYRCGFGVVHLSGDQVIEDPEVLRAHSLPIAQAIRWY